MSELSKELLGKVIEGESEEARASRLAGSSIEHGRRCAFYYGFVWGLILGVVGTLSIRWWGG